MTDQVQKIMPETDPLPGSTPTGLLVGHKHIFLFEAGSGFRKNPAGK